MELPHCPRLHLSPLMFLSLSFSLPLVAVVAAQYCGWMQWWRHETLTRTLPKPRENDLSLVARHTVSNKIAARSHSRRRGGFVFLPSCLTLVPLGALTITVRASTLDSNLATRYT